MGVSSRLLWRVLLLEESGHGVTILRLRYVEIWDSLQGYANTRIISVSLENTVFTELFKVDSPVMFVRGCKHSIQT